MFYVYVLQSDADQGLYIGLTADLRRRYHEHQAGDAKATAHRGPWVLICYEAYLEEADASGRERYLKSGGGRRFLAKQLRHHFLRRPPREGQ
ncbi:MAG: GIY-YIG nuclease family protein [Verrucomicrobia bacterium]|nr:GIY-YIG nuclease family protein [Verrucomicrobiota bacterium]